MPTFRKKCPTLLTSTPRTGEVGLARDHPEYAGFLRYAESHREVIRRFGRFPLRNGVLNRASTPDEIVYLREHPGY